MPSILRGFSHITKNLAINQSLSSSGLTGGSIGLEKKGFPLTTCGNDGLKSDFFDEAKYRY